MKRNIIQVEIKCIDNQPHVFLVETGEELEVVFGNFENAIFVKYVDKEYLVETDYPCWAGGTGYLRLSGSSILQHG